MSPLKIAILDLYAGTPNEGMRCIHQLVARTGLTVTNELAVSVFDVRGRGEVPGLDHDIYLSSGGPGSPLPSEESWEKPYFEFLDGLFAWNRANERKKFLLLICHSFQLASRHFGIGELSKRKSTSFGIFPMHKTEDGEADPLLAGLPEPFYAVDSRDYQVTAPNVERLAALGARVLCLEKVRPHVPLARALMAVRFTPEVVGTQFHPEADGDGMLRYLLTDEKRTQIVTNYGEEKYQEMVRLLQDPQAIELTESAIVPTFLRTAIARLNAAVSELQPTH